VGIDPTIVSLAPRRLSEVWESIETVGRALGDPETAGRLADRLRRRCPPSSLLGGPRVAVVEWLDPPILAGLWTPDVVSAAGGAPVGPPPGSPAIRTTWSAIAAERPDLVVVSPCSFSVGRSRRELSAPHLGAELASVRPPLGTFVADEAYFSRPGPRLADGVDLVRDLLKGSLERPPLPVVRWSPGDLEVSS
jgi:iron complex transport system substrate-binding protein